MTIALQTFKEWLKCTIQRKFSCIYCFFIDIPVTRQLLDPEVNFTMAEFISYCIQKEFTFTEGNCFLFVDWLWIITPPPVPLSESAHEQAHAISCTYLAITLKHTSLSLVRILIDEFETVL